VNEILVITLFVAVMLQPFHYDPNEKNRHKFLVQTLIVPDGVAEVQESLVWIFISSLHYVT